MDKQWDNENTSYLYDKLPVSNPLKFKLVELDAHNIKAIMVQMANHNVESWDDANWRWIPKSKLTTLSPHGIYRTKPKEL